MGRKAQKAKKKAAWENSESDEENEETTVQETNNKEEESSSSSDDEDEVQQQQSKKKGGNKKGGKNNSKAQDQQKQDQQKKEGGAASAAAKRPQPVQVIYCPISSWPAEMCEYNGNFAKCKQWHIDHAEELKVDAEELENEGEKGRKQRAPGDELGIANPRKANLPKEVSIDLRRRTGRKKLTIIKGLEMFGHQPVTVAQVLKKKFSCGTSVIDPPSAGMPAAVEMQGDNVPALVALLTGKDYDIPNDAIVLLKEGKPLRGGGGNKEESSSDEEETGAGNNDGDDEDEQDENGIPINNNKNTAAPRPKGGRGRGGGGGGSRGRGGKK